MSNPVPGWYDDPSGSAKLRYWDGTQWTEQYIDGAAAPAPQQAYGVPAAGQPSYAQPGYGQPNYGQTPAAPRSNGKAISALIFGIIGLATSYAYIGIIFSIIAVVQGAKARKNPFMSSMANVGRVLGIIGIIIWVIASIAITASCMAGACNLYY
ncbi:MAG: DUF2510 domain-containing protein [Coriobacteriia bacterium]|nr:DUF2510 domain-containing protein [Coriobacteriia bacterium]